MENIETRLDCFYNLTTWSRGWHSNITCKEEGEMLLIEEKVKDWIIQFFNEIKEEWSFLLKKEKIENRNKRLLKEVEDLLL
jgi:hypothetical protein